MNLLLIALSNKYAQCGIAGLIAGFIIGAKYIGMSNEESVRQLVAVLAIATGVK